MTRTIAYLRVSTEKQADKGVSLDTQRAKLKAYAELYDLDLCEVIVDAGESAKTLDRPGLQRALGMLKRREAEALLVVKLDRLNAQRAGPRAVEGYFAPGKAALLSVGEQIDTRSAAGRLVLNVLASVSQWGARGDRRAHRDGDAAQGLRRASTRAAPRRTATASPPMVSTSRRSRKSRLCSLQRAPFGPRACRSAKSQPSWTAAECPQPHRPHIRAQAGARDGGGLNVPRHRKNGGTVDLAGVRRARAELDRLAREHPQLIGESSEENRAGWEATLQEDEMTESQVIAFRFPPELVQRIERYSRHLSQLAGVEVPRTRVVLKLLELGLDHVEPEVSGDPRGPETKKHDALRNADRAAKAIERAKKATGGRKTRR